MEYDAERALDLLRRGTRLPEADFKPGQEDAIRQVIAAGRRALVVQKTGWGKSFVYFIAIKLLREAGLGPALLISPLLALMRNQIAAAERMGLRAATINSDNTDEWSSIEHDLIAGSVDVLLIHPKRLANAQFVGDVLSAIAARVSLLVIDEAHCISDWGHDFVPEYRLIERIARTLPDNLRLLATTATANNRVMEDLRNVLGPALAVQRGDLSRPSLALQTIRLGSQAERLAWLAEQIPALAGSGIVYTLTVRDANRVAAWLRTQGIDVAAYTGETGDARPELEQALLENRIKALIATAALGMGFDKPDLAFVIHFQAPASVVHYYQQVGRAGRALTGAYGVLLGGDEDTDITNFFIDSAFPSEREVRMVLAALERQPQGLSLPELEGEVNLSHGRIEKTISLLALESPAPIVKLGTKWQLTAARLGNGLRERAKRLTVLRRAEQAQMQEYVGLASGHMAFLIKALDGEPSPEVAPPLPPLPTGADQARVREAIGFLKRTSLIIEPRKQWPAGGLSRYGLRGKISAGQRAEQGRALCVWRDAGWGEAVFEGKYRHGRFSDELVGACVTMLAGWRPAPAPTWVTCIPSLRHPNLVPDFAQRLAAALGLPFVRLLTLTEQRPEQKTMANSAQQARNLDGALKIKAPVPAGPVLLIDDMADSRWTLAVAAWLLRSHGSGPVLPLVLALTGHD
jgi:ATP-dependent DNA helicase RecQ